MDRKYTILLSSSDLDMKRTLRAHIDHAGYNILDTSSDVEAIEILQYNIVDLFITSTETSPLDCWRMSRLIRSGLLVDKKKIPIILISESFSDSMVFNLAREYSINHVVRKQNLESISSLIESCLENPQAGLIRKRVLVVEDHENTALFVQKVLSKEYEVDLASDGEDGINLWTRKKYDLVILDIMLPGISGAGVLTHIINKNPAQTVIMMTAHASVDSAKTLMLEGASEYISKPFNADELRKTCNLVIMRQTLIRCSEDLSSKLCST